MATIKSHTDLPQSKRLAEFLPLESADMCYNNASIKGTNYVGEYRAELMEYNRAIKVLSKYTINPLFEVIPCWSLAVLINILPIDWRDYDKHYFLEIFKMGDISKPNEVRYYRFREQSDGADFGRITHISFQSDNLVDACVAMIEKLHELNLL